MEFCKHGHSWAENTYVTSKGIRRCKECHRISAAKGRAALPEGEYIRRYTEYNREHATAGWIKTKYGISLEDRDMMRVSQGGLCAICGEPPTGAHLAVDHCHVTGKIRQLLCTNCNIGLGQFKDSSDILEKAAAYLRRHEYGILNRLYVAGQPQFETEPQSVAGYDDGASG